ncbi:MAG TPA: O-antigen ligase family protein [Vicinamibacterales bacterium]|nr:O-antigen ligase family protein [Vicinamibacterales bacterium]
MALLAVAVAAAPAVAWLISEEYWRTLALLSLVGLLPFARRWPVTLVFGAYIFLIPFTSVAVVADSGGMTITKLIGVMAAGILLAVGLVERRLVAPPRAALWVFLLVLWAMVSLAWSVALESSVTRVPTALSLLSLYLVAVSFRVSERELRVVCLLAMVGGVMAATAGIILGFDADPGLRARGTLRVAEQAANPNGVAQSLLLPLSVGVAAFLISRSVWQKLLAIAAVGAIGAGILLTMSRGSLVAMIVMMCVWLFRVRVRWQVLLIIGALAALLPLMPDLFFLRVTNLITGEESTGAGRTEIWKVGLSLLQRVGWLGSGVDSFPTVYSVHGVPGHPTGAHNTLLSTSIELGVVGVVLLVLAVFSHLRMARASTSSMPGAAFAAAIEAACFGAVVTACFGDDLWTKTFWLPWILAVWSSRISTVGSAESYETVPKPLRLSAGL